MNLVNALFTIGLLYTVLHIKELIFASKDCCMGLMLTEFTDLFMNFVIPQLAWENDILKTQLGHLLGENILWG